MAAAAFVTAVTAALTAVTTTVTAVTTAAAAAAGCVSVFNMFPGCPATHPAAEQSPGTSESLSKRDIFYFFGSIRN